jgi:hypothetical protein
LDQFVPQPVVGKLQQLFRGHLNSAQGAHAFFSSSDRQAKWIRTHPPDYMLTQAAGSGNTVMGADFPSPLPWPPLVQSPL